MVSIVKKDNKNNVNNKYTITHYEECPICLESIRKKDVAVLNCNHQFHYKCIGLWMNSIIKNKFDTNDKFCPVCRNGDEIVNIICREKHIPIKKIIINNNKLLKKKKCIIS